MQNEGNYMLKQYVSKTNWSHKYESHCQINGSSRSVYAGFCSENRSYVSII